MSTDLIKNNKIILGTAQFGMDYGIANQSGRVNNREIESILNFAHKNGINTLDTAKIYGESEKSIGNYLKNTNKKWNVITKIKHTEESILKQLDDSREKLTINPSILLAHTAELYINKKFQLMLQRVKVEKLIHTIGVSLYNEKEINQVLEMEIKPEIIQLPINILDTRLYRSGILSELYKRGIEIHVRSVFLQGLFYLSKTDLRSRFEDVVPHLNQLESIALRDNLTIAELSLLWIVSLNEISKVIIGIDNLSQLKEHLRTLNKSIETSVFEEALSICYENEKILNPSLWQIT